jgi:hypothetical protein
VHDNTVRTQFHVCPQIRCNKIMHTFIWIGVIYRAYLRT